MILLDTCALLWLVADQTKLSPRAKTAIRDNTEWLFVSSISAFEIALKAKRNKLELPIDAYIWFEKALVQHGIQEIPLDSAICMHSVNLPQLHNDPCDRFIIATAIQNNMSLITCDHLIAQYPNVKLIW
ncbi:MAG: type II toxin-antitoxin system VapC family toxin [Bacillota bacterium]|jgi:PIN domain nuclease of toxin-antitoxin system